MTFVRVLFKTLIGLLILLLLVGVMLPDTAQVERSIQLNAPPEKIFPYLNSMRAYHEWSPWRALTHNKYTFSGPESGVDSRMDWRSAESDNNHGSMQVTVSEPFKQVRAKLDFGGKGGGISSFILSPGEQTNQTTLLWRFDAEFGWDLYGRYIGLLLDQMIGGSYEQGLQDLKKLVE